MRTARGAVYGIAWMNLAIALTQYLFVRDYARATFHLTLGFFLFWVAYDDR